MKLHVVSATAFVGLLAFGAAFAQSSSADQPPAQGYEGHHHWPPQQAIAACKDKSASAACSFTGRNGDTVTGQCAVPHKRADKDGDSETAPPLACRPDHAHADKHAQGSGSGD